MFFDNLPFPWQIAVTQAWSAFQHQTVPIGTCVIDHNENVISIGRNHIKDSQADGALITNHILAHAEMNALLAIHDRNNNINQCPLYTTVEPCPLCMGAIYMMGIREIHYAAQDPWAGSTNLLGSTPYLAMKPVHAHHTPIIELEELMVIINYYYFLDEDFRIGQRPARNQVKQKWMECHPKSCAFSEILYHQYPPEGGRLYALNPREGLEFIWNLYQPYINSVEL